MGLSLFVSVPIYCLILCVVFSLFFFFFFNDTATTEIYTLSLHDALQIWHSGPILSPGSRLSSSSDLSTLQPSAQAAPCRRVTCRPAYPRSLRLSRLWLCCSHPLGAGRRNSSRLKS